MAVQAEFEAATSSAFKAVVLPTESSTQSSWLGSHKLNKVILTINPDKQGKLKFSLEAGQGN